MDIGSVMDQLGEALEGIAGLRVYPFSAIQVQTPAAIVSFPETIDYDYTNAHGTDRIVIPITVVVGTLTDPKRTKANLAKYGDGSGAASIKAVLESGTYTAFDTCRVQQAVFDVINLGGADHVAMQFTVEVIGEG